MERQLAVKRFHPQVLATPGVSGRLSQAARTYGGLDHPRLARLAELGVAGGETFTAVEWVNGLDLARLLATRSAASPPLGDRPTVVLTRGDEKNFDREASHAALAALSTNSRHRVIAGAGHEIHLFEPAAVVQAIQDVVSSVRTNTPLRKQQ